MFRHNATATEALAVLNNLKFSRLMLRFLNYSVKMSYCERLKRLNMIDALQTVM